MTDDEAFYRLLEAEAKARLAKMTEQELIDLLIAQYGHEMTSNLLECYQSEEREREWNVKKPRTKRADHWRALATYLHEEGPETWDAKFAHIPDEHQEPLKLRSGKLEFHRRIGESRAKVKGPLVCCEFDDGRKRDEISFFSFERYLKDTKPRKSSGE